MKWGKRKDRKVYTTPKAQDVIFKKRASQNIERRIQEKGMSRQKSVSIEVAKGLVVTALFLYGTKKVGPLIGSKFVNRGKASVDEAIKTSGAQIFSKTLNRYLTDDEASSMGF